MSDGVFRVEKVAVGSSQKKRDRKRYNWPWPPVTSWHLRSLNSLHLRIATERPAGAVSPSFSLKSPVPVFSASCRRSIALMNWHEWDFWYITPSGSALKLVLSLCNTSIFISIYSVIRQQRGSEKCLGLIDIWPQLDLRVPGYQVSWSNVALKLNNKLNYCQWIRPDRVEDQRAVMLPRLWQWRLHNWQIKLLHKRLMCRWQLNWVCMELANALLKNNKVNGFAIVLFKCGCLK